MAAAALDIVLLHDSAAGCIRLSSLMLSEGTVLLLRSALFRSGLLGAAASRRLVPLDGNFGALVRASNAAMLAAAVWRGLGPGAPSGHCPTAMLQATASFTHNRAIHGTQLVHGIVYYVVDVLPIPSWLWQPSGISIAHQVRWLNSLHGEAFISPEKFRSRSTDKCKVWFQGTRARKEIRNAKLCLI